MIKKARKRIKLFLERLPDKDSRTRKKKHTEG
jgi:hypothetical protein